MSATNATSARRSTAKQVDFLVRAAPEPAGGAARRAGADRHEGRLQQRQLRRLQRDPERRAGQLLLRPRRRGRGRRRSRRSRASPSGDHLHPLQTSFLEDAALQCGICTPGFIVAAKALLDSEPERRRSAHPPLAGRQPLPLHGLRQDRARGAGRRRSRCARTPANGLSTTRSNAMVTDGQAQVQGHRHAAGPPGRRRQGHRPRAVRRRHPPAGHAARPHPAQPARPRHHQAHRRVEGAGARRA